MRDFHDLLSSVSAWPNILAMVQSSGTATILDLDRPLGERVLWSLQVTDRSPMGSVALNCGGILAASGWIRVYGGGDPGLVSWNCTPGSAASIPEALEGGLVVGADVLGGFFLLDGGGLGRPGAVHHLAADTLEIHDLGVGYSEWLQWVLTGDVAGYYASLRWPGWEEEVGRLDWPLGLHLYPPPWSVEGRDVGAASRKPVPLVELWGLAWESRRRLRGDQVQR